MDTPFLGRADPLAELPLSLRAPLIERSDHHAPSVFLPEAMLKVARRQKGLRDGSVPPVCVLDPDGDIVDFVRRHHRAEPSLHWACYHTEMWEWHHDDQRYGIVGRAVGAPFAVLVAEQLFSSGCRLVVSAASAGQIAAIGKARHVLIDRALRDEGTSYHYLPPSAFASANPALVEIALRAFATTGLAVVRGASWTTDAPYRETANTIAQRKAEGLLTVEMEAAALYAFAAAAARPILCLAQVTNALGSGIEDFEKGEDNGAAETLRLIAAFARAWNSEPTAATGRS